MIAPRPDPCPAFRRPGAVSAAAADRVNVGKATVFRNLPDGLGLIAAVLDEASDVPGARASDLADQPGDPVDLIEDMAFIREQTDAPLLAGLAAGSRAHG